MGKDAVLLEDPGLHCLANVVCPYKALFKMNLRAIRCILRDTFVNRFSYHFLSTLTRREECRPYMVIYQVYNVYSSGTCVLICGGPLFIEGEQGTSYK